MLTRYNYIVESYLLGIGTRFLLRTDKAYMTDLLLKIHKDTREITISNKGHNCCFTCIHEIQALKYFFYNLNTDTTVYKKYNN